MGAAWARARGAAAAPAPSLRAPPCACGRVAAAQAAAERVPGGLRCRRRADQRADGAHLIIGALGRALAGAWPPRGSAASAAELVHRMLSCSCLVPASCGGRHDSLRARANGERVSADGAGARDARARARRLTFPALGGGGRAADQASSFSLAWGFAASLSDTNASHERRRIRILREWKRTLLLSSSSTPAPADQAHYRRPLPPRAGATLHQNHTRRPRSNYRHGAAWRATLPRPTTPTAQTLTRRQARIQMELTLSSPPLLVVQRIHGSTTGTSSSHSV